MNRTNVIIFRFFYTPVTTEWTYLRPILTLSWVHVPFFLFLIFSWGHVLCLLLTLEVFILAEKIWSSFILSLHLRNLFVKTGIHNIFCLHKPNVFYLFWSNVSLKFECSIYHQYDKIKSNFSARKYFFQGWGAAHPGPAKVYAPAICTVNCYGLKFQRSALYYEVNLYRNRFVGPAVSGLLFTGVPLFFFLEILL